MLGLGSSLGSLYLNPKRHVHFVVAHDESGKGSTAKKELQYKTAFEPV